MSTPATQRARLTLTREPDHYTQLEQGYKVYQGESGASYETPVSQVPGQTLYDVPTESQDYEFAASTSAHTLTTGFPDSPRKLAPEATLGKLSQVQAMLAAQAAQNERFKRNVSFAVGVVAVIASVALALAIVGLANNGSSSNTCNGASVGASSSGAQTDMQTRLTWLESNVSSITARSKGDKGDVGPPGLTGPAGPAGVQGPMGPKGETGAQGPKGDTGATGVKGDTGLQGVRGDPGVAGAAGPTGATGATGVKGDMGLSGAQGPKGDTGPQGVKGDAGPQGPAGFYNASADVIRRVSALELQGAVGGGGSSCSVASATYDGNLGLGGIVSQEDADAWAWYLGNVQQIRGNVVVSSFTLPGVDLKGMLSKLKFITGDLTLTGNNYSTMMLQSLEGIGGNLILSGSNLISVDGLKSLRSIGGGLTLTSAAASLVNLEGLTNLVSIAGTLQLYMLPALVTVDGLRSLMTVGSGLIISSNPVLATLNGLLSLRVVRGAISITGNPKLAGPAADRVLFPALICRGYFNLSPGANQFTAAALFPANATSPCDV